MPVELSALAPQLQGFLLALARVAGLIAFVPFPGWSGVPDMGRAMLVVAIAIVIRPSWQTSVAAVPTLGDFLVLALTETAIGLTIGLVLSALSESLVFAAQMASLQAGYSYASIIDPMNHSESGLLSVLYQLVAGFFFFSFGVERLALSALARSFDWFGPASYRLTTNSAWAIVRLLGSAISSGLRIAVPVSCALILADVALAVVGKVSVQLQLLSLAFPVKMLLALALLSLCAPSLACIYGLVLQQASDVLTTLLGGSLVYVGPRSTN